jgi:uncharacterized repeat protein (TIGR01451 family)
MNAKQVTGSRQATAIAVAILMTIAANAHAAEKACIELKTSAQTEQDVVEQGKTVQRLVAAGKVVPGNEIVWTITAVNICKQPTDNVVVANPVPDQMTYVANSAMGTGADVTYSLDGKEFKSAADLQVRAADGSSRAARADEYRALRWTYQAPFAPGATAFVRYRAIVK